MKHFCILALETSSSSVHRSFINSDEWNQDVSFVAFSVLLEVNNLFLSDVGI